MAQMAEAFYWCHTCPSSLNLQRKLRDYDSLALCFTPCPNIAVRCTYGPVVCLFFYKYFAALQLKPQDYLSLAL